MVDQIDKTSVGKVNKRLLREKFAWTGPSPRITGEHKRQV
jgi:hypothetical protein